MSEPAHLPEEPGSADGSPTAAESSESMDTGSIINALGGVRGLLESTVPGVAFGTVFAFTRPDYRTPLIVAVAIAVAILVVALVQRRSVQQTISGFIGIALTAGIVLVTGRARDFFLVGLYRNAFWLAAHTVTGAVRWPLIGLLLGPFTGEGVQWRKRRERLRAYQWCGVVWIAVFAIRLAVQLPLFRGDQVVALGLVGIVLGLPLFLAACLANYLILRRVPMVRSPQETSTDATVQRQPPPVTPG